MGSPPASAVRGFVRPTAALQFRARFFKGLFRLRRTHPTDVPSDPGKVTLWNQAPLPDDLRLPTPAQPLDRIGAGLVDATVSVLAGGVAAAVVHTGSGGDMDLAVAAGQAAALAAWVVRDAAGDGGNRSLGKRVFGLELAYWDGALPSRAHALLRNWYFAALPFMGLHPLAELAGSLPLVFDASSVLLTQDARKVGDYMLGTRVVTARPDRATRLADARDAEEVRMLRDAVEEAAPGLLADSEAPADAWYENVQASLTTSAAAATAAATAGAASRAAAAAAASRAAAAAAAGARSRAAAAAAATPVVAPSPPAAAAAADLPTMPPSSSLPAFLVADVAAVAATAKRPAPLYANKPPAAKKAS